MVVSAYVCRMLEERLWQLNDESFMNQSIRVFPDMCVCVIGQFIIDTWAALTKALHDS